MTSTIPCRRPKVEVLPHPSRVPGAHQALCRVPGCPEPPFTSVRAACEEQATRHRKEHRAAVPQVTVERDGAGFAVSCGRCGRSAREAGRGEADTWAAHHLASAHGLVVCP